MRFAVLAILVFLTSCGSAPPPAPAAPRDPTAEEWYGKASARLAAMDREAEALFQRGKADEAAAMIQQAEPVSSRLLAVPKPTLAAMEAASDLDQLYGRMLFSNRNYGWARLLFQKNRARWKNWTPQTAETARRLKLAESAMAECDQRL